MKNKTVVNDAAIAELVARAVKNEKMEAINDLEVPFFEEVFLHHTVCLPYGISSAQI